MHGARQAVADPAGGHPWLAPNARPRCLMGPAGRSPVNRPWCAAGGLSSGLLDRWGSGVAAYGLVLGPGALASAGACPPWAGVLPVCVPPGACVAGAWVTGACVVGGAVAEACSTVVCATGAGVAVGPTVTGSGAVVGIAPIAGLGFGLG